MLFHDLGKGRGGDHSEIGARMVERTGPRLGLSAEQVETVAWLVRHHLLLSRTAFKRDADDPKTVSDVAEVIQSPERLRLLLIMTAADIRAVGPTVWNGWKGQLLRTLYHETDAALAGTAAGGRKERIAAAQQALAEGLRDWPDDAVRAFIERQDARYWLSFATDVQRRHATLVRAAEADGQAPDPGFPDRPLPRPHRDAAVHARPSRPVHEDRRGDRPERRQHRRRPHLHHRRWHGARQLRPPERRRSQRGRGAGAARAHPAQHRAGARGQDLARPGAGRPPVAAGADRGVPRSSRGC